MNFTLGEQRLVRRLYLANGQWLSIDALMCALWDGVVAEEVRLAKANRHAAQVALSRVRPKLGEIGYRLDNHPGAQYRPGFYRMVPARS